MRAAEIVPQGQRNQNPRRAAAKPLARKAEALIIHQRCAGPCAVDRRAA